MIFPVFEPTPPSALYLAFLVEEEGTASSFRGLHEVIDKHGLFCEPYTDRRTNIPTAAWSCCAAHRTI